MMNEHPIIILHGWGLRGQIYDSLSNLLKRKGYKVFAPDLPGFGSEPLESESMILDDYIEFVDNFMKKNSLSKPILIGHSFGGRIAIKYTWKYQNKISKLILTGVPITREISILKRVILLTAIAGHQLLKLFPAQIRDFLRKRMYFIIGEWDYYKAGKLKETFKKIISEDLLQYIKEIKLPIIFVWGKEDTTTPVFNLNRIKKYLPLAEYKIISGTGHKLPYQRSEIFLRTIEPFI